MAFASSDLKSGDKVCIFMPNCRVEICVTDKEERRDALGSERSNLPKLKAVWTLSEERTREAGLLVACREGNDAVTSDFADMLGEPDNLATLIYTSGTTGPPKGVKLTHGVLLWNAAAVAEVNAVTRDDLLLSILPLAQAFERTLGYMNPVIENTPVAFARSVETLSEEMRALRPTVMLAVPRLFDRAKARITDEASKSHILATLLKWTEKIGWERRLAVEAKNCRLL